MIDDFTQLNEKKGGGIYDNDIYTLKEVSAHLKIGQSTLRKHVGSGTIKSVRIGRQIRIPKQFMEEYLIQTIPNTKINIPKDLKPTCHLPDYVLKSKHLSS